MATLQGRKISRVHNIMGYKNNIKIFIYIMESPKESYEALVAGVLAVSLVTVPVVESNLSIILHRSIFESIPAKLDVFFLALPLGKEVFILATGALSSSKSKSSATSVL